MRLPNSKSDMISQIAQETGRSRALVNFVITNFEKTLRFFLSNPVHAGSAILLKGFGKFTFDKKRARRRLDRLMRERKREYINEYLNKFDNE